MSPFLNIACPQSRLSSKLPVLNVAVLNVACPQSPIGAMRDVLSVIFVLFVLDLCFVCVGAVFCLCNSCWFFWCFLLLSLFSGIYAKEGDACEKGSARRPQTLNTLAINSPRTQMTIDNTNDNTNDNMRGLKYKVVSSWQEKCHISQLMMSNSTLALVL